MEETPDGSGHFTRVILRPEVTVAPGTDIAKARELQAEAHAKCFRALHGDQAHLSADVVSVFKPRNLCFVVIGVALQVLNAVFERLAESGADFEAILQGGIVHHGRHLWSGYWPHFSFAVSSFFRRNRYYRQALLSRQITESRDGGNHSVQKIDSSTAENGHVRFLPGIQT